MTDEKTKNDLQKVLFTNLIMMLGSTTMQQLGKLVNPMTNKTDVDLDGAQTTIDMIEMLKAKTTGNLDDDENKIVTDVLSSLQMNYVETSNAAPAKEEPKAEEKTDEPEEEKKEDKEETQDKD